MVNLVRHLGISQADEGEMRCDVNVSLRRPGGPFGTRCEIKNVAGQRFVAKAIEYEISRQMEVLENGGQVVKETRYYDAAENKTHVMRAKQEEVDYRYVLLLFVTQYARFLPEPDLPSLLVEQSRIENIKQAMPELPDALIEKYMSQYGMSLYDSTLIVENGAVTFFESVAKGRNPKTVSHWYLTTQFCIQ
jgi:aspartyl-tRNA(Asn)/glutamyl-tRNA(Gln) amidotransferase subunit B